MAIKRVIKKKRPKRLLGIIVLVISVAVICGFFYYQRQQLQKQYNALEAEEQSIKSQIEAEKKRADQLEDYKAYVQTKSYIEKMAREVLGLVYEDEAVFQVKDGE